MEGFAMKQGIALFFFIVILLFSEAVDNHKHVVTFTHSPAPQPQPPTSLPMHGTTEGSLKPQECGTRCGARCSNTQYKKPCLFFCNKCCAKCLCVPAGTYGNKQFCPCYNDWKTKRGGPKCP